MNYGPNMNSEVTLNFATMIHSASLDKMPCDKDHILVAAFPKSGSIWLSEILAQLPEQTKVQLIPGFGRRAQELAFERLIAFHGMNYVAQHHIMFSPTTAAYCNTFSIKPIVTCRNIFDTFPSLKDWLDTFDVDNPEQGPILHIPREYFGLSDHDKFDFLIDITMPWYFLFILGWQECKDCIWINYEKLLGDPVATLTYISNEIGLGLSKSAIEGALEKAGKRPTKKNICKIGRGELLTAAQKNKIRKFASYYPSQDLSAIGL